ncbi:hypothetical protein [Botrimarina hoheduenensis]|uniref:PEP-CTERM protein-sorting domain-containing protein n=1 Tax=Botrimarina hoheduenensis TaxID=2528000 RepID=A0A5C5VX10_9BACT|nr:hypothetical protein [Botrimarina hoheduenensis]TWT43158.1 hypothetical protein Pla111_21080 [Botrimarina hoheduenensis]
MKPTFVGALCLALLPAAVAPGLETITVRSGQSLGLPGAPGALDDSVSYNPWGNPGGSPVLATAFTPADFAATTSGPSAVVISPVSPWMGGAVAPLSDPLARWINFRESFIGQTGAPGSALYSVPFTIQSQSFSQVLLCIEGGVDDTLGDSFSGDSPNLEGLYVNGIAVPSSLTTINLNFGTFNFAQASTHTVDITASVTPGLNHFYLLQRDVGFGVSGLIFSATIKVIPEPTCLTLVATLAVASCGRRPGRRLRLKAD